MCPVTIGLQLIYNPKWGKMYLQNALKYFENVIFQYTLFKQLCCLL